MTGRRLSYLLLASALVGIAGVLAYPTLAGGASFLDKRLGLGGSLIVGPIGIVVGIRCLRWGNKNVEAANDPAAIINLVTPQVDIYAIALALLSMAIGFFLLLDVADVKLQMLAWVGMVACPATAGIVLVKSRATWLRLSPDGLEFSAHGVGLIRWKDIRRARSTSAFGRVPVVALDLDNEEEYQARRQGLRLPFLERLLLSSSFTIAPPTIDMSCDMLVKAIDIRIAASRRGSQPA